MTRKALSLFALAFVLCSPAARAATNSVLYTDNFEIMTNGTPLIDGTNYWYASSSDCIVQTNVVAQGSTNAAMIPIDTTLSNRFIASRSTNVWLRMQTRIVRYNRDAYPLYDTNSTAIFYVNSNGYAVVRNGAVGWSTITTNTAGNPAEQIAETNFNMIDVYLDYTNKTWRLVVNSVTLTNNIAFVNQSATNLLGFDIYNAGLSTSFVDNVLMYDTAALPALSVDPTVLTNSPFYQVNAPNNSFNVITRGDGQLSYYIITNSSDWGGDWSATIITNATGSMTNNATNTVGVTYSTVNLAPGTYYNSFNVISTNWEGQTQTVQLVVNVRGMTVSTNYLRSSRMIGYAADTQTFNVVQTGTGDVTYAISTNANWLSASPVSGTLTNGQTNTISVSYFTNGLSAGTVTAILAVATAQGGGVTQNVYAIMTTYSRPVPSVSFTNYYQTLQKGQQPTDTNLYISNNCVVPRPRMNYAVTSDVPWLLVNSNGTTTNAESKLITVHFGDMTTNSGLNTGHLTLRGTDAGPSGSYSPTGQVTVSTQVTVRVLINAPGRPTGLSATKGTYADSVHLAWTTTTNVNHFDLWRGTNSDMSNATRFETNATSVAYTDTGVNPGIITYYWIKAINAYGGDGDFSAPDTGWRPLSAPTGLAASDGLYTNRVALSWTASDGALSYEIWRSTINLTNTATLVNTVAGALTAYDDTSAVVETTYYYWIKSRTPYMGTYGDPDTGYRAALMQPQSVVASDGEFTNKVRVIWQAVDQASTYEVWRNSTSDRSSAVKIADSTASGYDDETASQGVYLYYWIRAANFEGYSRYSDPDAGWRQLLPPSGIAVTKGSYPYRIRVTWDASQNASSYEVWRGEGTGIGSGVNTSPTKINQITTTYYDDHAVVNTTPYYYKVKAIGALGGSSDYSSTDYGWREIAAATTIKPVKNDYDGDHLSDLTMFVPTSGVFQIVSSTLGQRSFTFGIADGEGVRGDYDGDGTADPMVYWAGSGTWVVMLSAIGYTPLIAGAFGGGGVADTAVADFDGDTVTDLGVYNETDGTLAVLLSNGGAFNAGVTVAIGGPGWTPASADYDGDAKADPAVYSAAEALLAAKLSASGYPDVIVPIGGAGITFHPADYDGDAKADLVTYEEASGSWVAKISSAGYASIPLSMGSAGYKPLIADYDGDAKTDPALYNETTGAWMIKFSASGYPTIEDSFGGTNTVPVGR